MMEGMRKGNMYYIEAIEIEKPNLVNAVRLNVLSEIKEFFFFDVALVFCVFDCILPSLGNK